MERPGFNPQALARKPGSQRSGANKEKKQAARHVRRRSAAGGNGGNNGGACGGHRSIRLLRGGYSIFLGFAQDGERGSRNSQALDSRAAPLFKCHLKFNCLRAWGHSSA
jgi:hypothetical protein